MTKKEIVKQISEEVGLPLLQTREVVQRTFGAIIGALVADGRIELRNFGVFEVRRRASRKARNPRTGATLIAPARSVVTFQPGKAMEGRVGGPGAEGDARGDRAGATDPPAPGRGPKASAGPKTRAARGPA